MFKFIHTGDWQIGMRAAGLPPAAAERVRAARFASVTTLLAAAVEHRADAVLVAGDCFEDNGVAPALVERLAAVLNDAPGRPPVYLIPGNHDPASLDSVWHRPIWRQLRPHVRVLLSADPVVMADGVTLFPCPLSTRHGTADPTSHIPPRPAGDASLRIGLAHGTMRILPGVGDDDFPIPTDAAERLGLDYLALGHWHSVLASPDGRAWYSGTHEATKFGERESGRALLVTLSTAGVPPVVATLRSGALTWADAELDASVEPGDDVLRRHREWPDADRCLLRLTLRGPSTAESAAVVAQLREVLSNRFLHHACDDANLTPADPDVALAGLAGLPHVIRAADELKSLAAGQPGEVSAAVAARALQLLYDIAWSNRQAGV